MDTQRIIDLLLEGEVDRAVELSSRYFDSIHNLAPTDVMYFEPRMHINAGHFGRLASAYLGVLSEAGLKTTVLHRYGSAADARDNWLGVFPVPDHVVGVSEITSRDHLETFAAYFERIFGECLSGSCARLAIFATCRFLTMPGAVRAIEQAHGVHGAIFGVMETYPVPDCNDREVVEDAFRGAAELIERSNKSYLVFAESDPIRDFLIDCGLSAKRVFTNPYPAAHRFPKPPDRKSRNRRPHLGSLAGTREVQNPGLLAAYLLESDTQDVDWTVRLNLELAAGRCDMTVSDLRRALMRKDIKLIEDRMSNAEYDLALQSLDVMLLPYGDRYQTIGSGIFLESLCAGIIPLVHKDSTMRRLYVELGGRAPAIEELSVEGMQYAVSLTEAHFEDLRKNMLKVRRSWFERDDGPVAWVRRVQDFISTRTLRGNLRGQHSDSFASVAEIETN